eukprot:2719889-Amphidinium_carterae.1
MKGYPPPPPGAAAKDWHSCSASQHLGTLPACNAEQPTRNCYTLLAQVIRPRQLALNVNSREQQSVHGSESACRQGGEQRHL